MPLMNVVFKRIIDILTTIKILEVSDGGRNYRFMRRSLFYLPLLSLFIATAFRLVYIVYRLGDLSKCNLKVNEIFYDTRNTDIVFLDFSIDGCSLPANCEFIKTIVSVLNGPESLITVSIGTFVVKKNEYIRVRCPVKVNDISLSCFFDTLDTSKMVLEFVLYLKVRFLFVNIPISFKSLVKCDSSKCETPTLSFGLFNHRLLGKLNDIKLRSTLTVKNLPKYINIKASTITVESDVFVMRISPIIIRNGCLDRTIYVELQLLLHKSEKMSDLIKACMHQKIFLTTLDRIDNYLLRQLFAGISVGIDNSTTLGGKIFLFHPTKNKIIYVYECGNSNFDISHLKKQKRTQGKFKMLMETRVVDENIMHNYLNIRIGQDEPCFYVYYQIQENNEVQVLLENERGFELLDITTIKGYLFLTFKIDISFMLGFLDILLDSSLLFVNLRCQSDTLTLPIIVSIKSSYLFVTIVINEIQLEKCFKLLKNFYEFQITIDSKLSGLDVFKGFIAHVDSSGLRLIKNQEILYSMNFNSNDSSVRSTTVIHKLIDENGKTLSFSSKLTLKGEPGEYLPLYVCDKNIHFNIATDNLYIDSNIIVKTTFCKSKVPNIEISAISLVEVLNLKGEINETLYEHIIGNGIFTMTINNEMKLYLHIDDYFNKSIDPMHVKLPRLNFVETTNWYTNGILCGTLEKEDINHTIFTSWTIVNIIQIDSYALEAFTKWGKVLDISILDLEITCIMCEKGIYFYITKQASLFLNIFETDIIFNELEFDFDTHLLLQLLIYNKSSRASFIDPQGYAFSDLNTLKLFVDIYTELGTTIAVFQMDVHDFGISEAKHNISLMERTINVYKNGVVVSLDFKRCSDVFYPNWALAVECKFTKAEGYNPYPDKIVVEILTDQKDVMTKVIFNDNDCGPSSIQFCLDHLHFEKMACKIGNECLEVGLEGFLDNLWLKETISDIGFRMSNFLFGRKMPKTSIIQIHIVNLPILITSEHNAHKVSEIVMSDSWLLYEINLEEYFSTLCENELIRNADTQNSSYEHLTTSPTKKKTATTQQEHAHVLPNDSVLYFVFHINISTFNSEIIINIPKLELSPIFNLFCSSQTLDKPLFRLKFIQKRLFILSLRYKLKVTCSTKNHIFLEVREGYKVFMQFLIDLTPKSKHDDFYILGFTSFNVLYQDYGFFIRRLFQFPLTIDIKQENELIVRSQIVYKIPYLINLALIPMGFVDLLVYSSSAFSVYRYFNECRIFETFASDEDCFEYESYDELNAKIELFETRLSS